jgi:dolichyl-phosphate-mannose-protein mannosyltransferase
MSVAEPAVLSPSAPEGGGDGEVAERRWPWLVGLGVVLAVAFGLRVWGVKQGLPFAYNADENAHFVPNAIGLFGHGWNPHYFVNPPAYTYLLHLVFEVWFGGRAGVSKALATNPTEVFVVARLTAAVVGTIAVWLLYLAGARLFGRAVGLLAAALLGVSFLPVFYSHLALNDVPTLAPIALSLWGTAGVLREGRLRDYLIAGVGLGLACATKYTGGIVLLPLVAAGGIRLAVPDGRYAAARGLVLAGVVALAAFVVANPYAVLDLAAFRDGLQHQADAADDALGKLGLTQSSGHLYYLWTFTWGLGWAPLVAGVVGIGLLAVDDRRALLVLAPAPILYVLYMGTQARFFGRWLLPVFPIACLLGAYAVVRLSQLAAKRVPALAPALAVLGSVLLLGQGLVYSLHSAMTLSRPDTRNKARAWLVDHVPANTKIVVEPVVPDAWATDIGHLNRGTANGARWSKFPTSRSNIADDGSFIPGPGRIVNIEDYERTLYPGLIDKYVDKGYCWVVVGSTQRGRAEAQPEVVPRAVEYYRDLERRSTLAYEASPYREGAGPVKFNFDWTFDFYPLAYARAGPVMQVYRLKGGKCG